MKIRQLFILAALVWVIQLMGCSDCRKLADAICECENTQTAQAQCRQNLELYSQHPDFTKAVDEGRCSAILNSPACTCNAIRNHEFEKCGMTREPVP